MWKSKRGISTVLFFFNDAATTEIYTLSLHDALPISDIAVLSQDIMTIDEDRIPETRVETTLLGGKAIHDNGLVGDRKSTRLNSSHSSISYAVFCLKKTKQHN